jgi:hypothetical protein
MRTAIVVLALALAVPAAAAAKEVTSIDLCGSDGCTRIADHAALRAFEQGSAMAAAAPADPQRSYLLRVRLREGDAASVHGWTSRWLPSAGLIASEDGPGNFVFTPVGPKLERALRDAARGRTARAARRFAPRAEPEAQVDEVFAPATATVARAGDEDGGLPTLAWLGLAAGLLAVGGAGAAGLRRR